MTRWGLLCTGLVAIGCEMPAAVAVGAGLGGVADAWLLAPADLAAVWATRESAPPPERRTPSRGPWAAVGHARLWGMPDLPVRELSLGGSFGGRGSALQLGGAWQRTGDELVAVERLAAWVGWEGRWGGRATVIRETLRSRGAAVPLSGAWSVEVGPNLRFAGDGALRLRVTVIAAPPAAGSRGPRPVARCLVVHQGAACALVWERRPDAAPVLGAELCVAAVPGIACGFRYDGASRSLGPGLAVQVGGAMVRTSHVLHPVLGVTHRVQFVFGARSASGPTGVP